MKSGLVAAAVLVVLLNVGKDLANATYTIDEPSKAAAGDDFVPMLKDEMGRLTKAGYIDSTPQPEAVEAEQPKFKVVDTEVSLGFVTTLIRKALGQQIKHISGELALSEELGPCSPKADLPTDWRSGKTGVYRLTLRASDDSFGPFFSGSGCLDAVIRDGAIATLGQIDPVTASGALSTRLKADKAAALRLIEATVAAQTAANSHGLRAVLPFMRKGLHRALLMKGLVEERLDQHADAARDFQLADDAYRQQALIAPRHWHIAEDDLGYALIKMADEDFDHRRSPAKHFAAAADAVNVSLAEQPDYSSALYHRAMIDDHQAREVFEAATREPPETTDLCPGYHAADRARIEYARLLEANPTFAVGHYDWAVMDLQELLFVQMHDKLGCAEMTSNPVEPLVATLDAEAEQRLEMAAGADPSSRLVYVQMAYLAMQRQEPGFVHPGRKVPNPAERLRQLERARSEVGRALRWGPPGDDTVELIKKVEAKEAELFLPSSDRYPGSAEQALGAVQP